MKIRQYIPAFVSVDKAPVEAAFEDLPGLFGIPFVAGFRQEANFDHFAISPVGRGWLLLAVYDKGQSWWVVGHINQLSQTLENSIVHWREPLEEAT